MPKKPDLVKKTMHGVADGDNWIDYIDYELAIKEIKATITKNRRRLNRKADAETALKMLEVGVPVAVTNFIYQRLTLIDKWDEKHGFDPKRNKPRAGRKKARKARIRR